jgi:hypothetical protein
MEKYNNINMEKYIVYKNDLKYKKNRRIDPNRAIWSTNNLEKEYNDIDHDSIKYRIEEWKKSSYKILDLSNMELKGEYNFNLFYDKYLSKIQKYTTFLCLSDNKLCNTIDLREFKNLDVLDIRCNKIKKLIIPDSLTELNCDNNEIEEINFVDSLQFIDCANNKIKSIKSLPKLERLSIYKNIITNLEDYPKLTHLDCSENPIEKVGKMYSLEYFDCGKTKIKELYKELYPNLEILMINNTKIKNIPIFNKLITLEMLETNIKHLDYLPNLKDIYCDSVFDSMSDKYNKENIKVSYHKGKYLTIVIN